MSSTGMTLLRVSSRDTVAYAARLMLLFTWLMLFVLVVYMAAGGERPRESPAEIALGMAVLTALFVLIIAARKRALGRLAACGAPVPAEIYHASHFQFFMTLGFRYEWQGRAFRRMVQLPYGSATRFLAARKQVLLAVDRDEPRRFIVRDLYEPAAASSVKEGKSE